jgi:hypothetical protein
MGNTTGISTEEQFLAAYFEELKENGLIKKITYQPNPFILSDIVEIELYKQLKTKKTYRFKTLMQPHSYTADFKIVWEKRNTLYKDIKNQGIAKFPTFFANNDVSWIECKAQWDHQNMTRIFTLRTQPWIYQLHGIYVNLIKVPDIFKSTFIPESILKHFFYKIDDRYGKFKKGDKKFPWEYRTLKQYLNDKA